MKKITYLEYVRSLTGVSTTETYPRHVDRCKDTLDIEMTREEKIAIYNQLEKWNNVGSTQVSGANAFVSGRSLVLHSKWGAYYIMSKLSDCWLLWESQSTLAECTYMNYRFETFEAFLNRFTRQ